MKINLSDSPMWSATPTPFTSTMTIDVEAVKRLIDHHLQLGVTGLFLCGTCGEGPWMTDRQKQQLIGTCAKYAKGRLILAVQATDNSAARIRDNIALIRNEGGDIGVIAPPLMVLPQTPKHILALYLDAIRQSPLPVGIYDRGKHAPVFVPDALLKSLYAEPKVILVKDSSGDSKRMNLALQVKKKRKDLYLLNGNEFDCISYLQAGYDGLLLGGGIFNGFIAGQIIAAVGNGDISQADKLQNRMNRLMFEVYGGKKISCWLTGLKHLLVQMGIFRTTRNYLGYPLTASCIRAIDRVLKKDREVLFPGV
ncbi:MAG: dihydrodipicolinate synthase family protein [Phycisphaerae bacterium]